MTDYTEARLKFVNWIKQSLTGEKLKDDILFESNPLNRYTTGILYSAGAEYERDDPIGEDDNDAEGVSSPKKTKYQPPSSMGFSFYIDKTLKSLRVFYSAVIFEDGDSPNHVRRWEKHSLVDDDGEEIEVLLDATSRHDICKGRARIDVIVRSHGDGKIATVTLSNNQHFNLSGSEKERDELAKHSLFEAELRCFLPEIALRNYPRVSKALLTEEEQELELRYKDEHVYAIGHGVAVDWRVDNGEVELFSDFMPVVEVPQVTANTAGKLSEVLSFEFLKSIQSNSSVFEQLDAFVNGYSDWIETQEDVAAESGEDDEQETSRRLISRMEIADSRMRSSISLMRENEDAQLAFALANQAMLAQMELNGAGDSETPYSWRPFQLAFFLMALESAIDEDSDYRDWVDLIWFPTGGGKTEAYLGVMAFVFVYRRLQYSSSGGGTTAIMRYTLRLLTSQQFVRACKVVSALEFIRRETPALGDEPYSVGLWLGGESSPNTFDQALEQLNKGNFSKYILRQCPWCATEFTKENYKATETSFHFSCSNRECAFGCEESNVLPFNIVDEALYKNPPSLLIATVDKFARLPWESRAGAFFGGNNNRPPELIIQDELHLISGALGSIVGLYEVGFEAILVSRGVYPKFIASTATIRKASEQVKALFGRDMAVFPPVGLHQKDSYFAREVPLSEKPGRLYVGYMAFGRQRQNCLEDLAGALVAAPQVLFSDQIELKDAWWTQMIYHAVSKGWVIAEQIFRVVSPVFNIVWCCQIF